MGDGWWLVYCRAISKKPITEEDRQCDLAQVGSRRRSGEANVFAAGTVYSKFIANTGNCCDPYSRCTQTHIQCLVFLPSSVIANTGNLRNTFKVHPVFPPLPKKKTSSMQALSVGQDLNLWLSNRPEATHTYTEANSTSECPSGFHSR